MPYRIKREIEENITNAITAMRQKYGVSGLDGQYLLATDIDGDLRICPMGLTEKIYYDLGYIVANNFIKIRELNAL
jgi:hypothetical protein